MRCAAQVSYRVANDWAASLRRNRVAAGNDKDQSHDMFLIGLARNFQGFTLMRILAAQFENHAGSGASMALRAVPPHSSVPAGPAARAEAGTKIAAIRKQTLH
jgi:hypothetical protein